MTNIEKIRQEIERRLRDYSEDTQFEIGKRRGYKNILDFIDSLPEEDPLNDPRFGEGFDAGRAVQRIFDETEEKPSEDLEKAASRLGFDYVDNIVHESPEHRWNDHDVEFGYRDGFIAGAEWQRSQTPMPEDTVIFMKGVEEGRRLEREEREENKRKEDELPRYYGD